MKSRLLITVLLAWLPLVAAAQSLSLEECLSMASENGYQSRRSSLSVDMARAQRNEALWEYFPRVSVTTFGYDALNPLLHLTLRDVLGNSDAANVLRTEITDWAYQNGVKPYYDAFRSGWGSSVSVIQPLFAGGRIINGNRLARLGADAAVLQDSLARTTLRDSVENKYWRIVALQEKRAILNQTADFLSSLDKDLSSAVEAGLALETDLLQLRLKKGELEAGRYMLEGGLALAKMDLFSEIGYPYRYQDLSSIELSESLEDLPSPTEILRPDVSATPQFRLLDMQVEATKLQKKMAVGELLPQVAIGGMYGYTALSRPRPGRFNGVVFATLQIPITDMGKALQRSKRYDYQVKQAALDAEYLQEKLQLLEGKLRLEMESAWNQLQVTADAVEVATRLLAQMRTQYAAGRITASELMRVSLEVNTARENLLSRRIAYRKALRAYLALQS